LETTPLYAEVLAQAGEFEQEADAEDAAEDSAQVDDGPPDESDGQPLRDLLDSVRGGGRS
jgi:hypothetical protein